MLNKVILMGRLVADPELKQTQSGISVARFSIAVDRPYVKDKEKQTDFVNITVWRSTAEFVSRYFSKGKMIIVEGSLRNNNYTDNNGVKHYSMEVQADNVLFGESKSGDSQGNSSGNFRVPEYASGNGADIAPSAHMSAPNETLSIGDMGDFEEILSDGDVPF